MNDDVVKERSHDELRRDELMVIMKDRSLGREKKARRMEEVRQKYAAREVADDEQPGATLEKLASKLLAKRLKILPTSTNHWSNNYVKSFNPY